MSRDTENNSQDVCKTSQQQSFTLRTSLKNIKDIEQRRKRAVKKEEVYRSLQKLPDATISGTGSIVP